MNRFRFALALLGMGLGWGSTVGAAGGLTPEEAVKAMTLPPGFSASVYASEPMIRQPLSATFDARGRLWVIEYLQYPVPAGLKPVTVDQYLRTEYDRVPEPPPKGPRGADRIKILEDTDNDGKLDKETIFLEGLNLASALAVGYDGVYIGQAPYLLYYPDKNHDDKPDGDPEVLLSGFGLQDAHSTVNSMNFGPDGWLYGSQGSTVTARIRGTEFQQGIWRFHPRTKKFELFAEGGGNTWGLDFDRLGNIFGSSNGGFVTFHMVQSGYYWKGFAKHGPLHNPHTYGYFNSIDYVGNKLGGHVTPGGILYKGDAMPESFRNVFIGGNLLSNAVYWHELSGKGSTYSGKHGGVLIDAHDPWFRPIDVSVGPDGAIYVVDWYDKRASHLDPRDNWDKTNGRIYRVVYDGGKRVAPFDLYKLTSEQLVDLRTSKNDWQAATARLILAERQDSSVVPRLKKFLTEDRDEVFALRDLWALYVSGGFDEPTAYELLKHPVAPVRKWVVRLLGDQDSVSDRIAAELRSLAENEADPQVRSQLASSCQRFQGEVAWPVLEALVNRKADLTDGHIPMLDWWAAERLARVDRKYIDRMLQSGFLARPVVAEIIEERLARLLAATSRDADAAKLLATAPGPDHVGRILTGLEKGLEGRKVEQVGAELKNEAGKLLEDSKGDVTRFRLALRLGSESAREKALATILDPTGPAAQRIALIEVLGQIGNPAIVGPFLGLMTREKNDAVKLALLDALGRIDSGDTAPALLAAYPTFSASVRGRLVDTLSSRKSWATQLVEAMASGRVATKEVRPPQIQQMARLADPALTRRIEAVWGRVPGPGSAEKVKRIAEIRGILPEGDKGSPARGKAVFKENCAVCHKLFNEGEAIGPELTGSERGNLDFLLTSLVDPSALIRKEYQGRAIALKDGRVLNGLILEQNDKALTLIDSKRQKIVIPVDGIEEDQPSSVSVMPEGLLDTLKDEQIRDLFRYLQSR